MGMSIISEKLEDIRNYLDVEVHPVVSPDRWDIYAALCDMVDDTIAMLKAQEPHVLTLDEVKAMKRYTICAVEQRSKVLHTTFNAEYYATVTIGQRNYLDFGLYADVNPFRRSEGGYGKTWRCWNTKPSKEQMEAVKWDE